MPIYRLSILTVLIFVMGCTPNKSIDEERKAMIESYRSAADCLEDGHPIVKCQQRAYQACKQ